MLRRSTLGSYHQHDFSRLSSEKYIFLAKAYAQLADNIYTKYLLFQQLQLLDKQGWQTGIPHI